ncbi:TfoX/Sxy family DNA transformation protein [Shimwellia blattae]|uniref:Putative DNA transformation protein with TfoX domain n=1 Tax=Shimwellia blattae (strain ATCC 29907 / DSM 4481 / JCM 1650 / NBRC 105725 / CDC 9005-74) TaxID=630626 RepID=I2BAK5_SHIBC|nr:TfoX/Sxy family DNA transformation protein [Shimwellia blattae]AFJ47559.1 putative DNA transformation protein with TfoX domain [Shimwellia blattae DSM 4481 = NBRC 105725]GAB79863.1 Sxy protein [Shimwellia blattae DSM 4481 = NBRC 105725]VDY65058.1 Regulator of competence-specific genes [Shimwellia blattae]VEC23452.1 Regulator of competence-specific genes [Shimwellia blattae]
MKKASLERIRASREYLSELGEIKHRALFGGYSLFVDNTVFAMVAEGELYLRACEQAATYVSRREPGMLSIHKRGRAVALQYYHVDDELWEDKHQLLTLSRESLRCAQDEKQSRKAAQRLKDLPNLSLRIEMLLQDVGVDDVNTLIHLGARACWIKLRKVHPFIGINILYALEGAIRGVHLAALPAARRRELQEWWLALQRDRSGNLSID